MTIFDIVHFSRPWWLIGLPLTLLLSVFVVRKNAAQQSLNAFVDPHLLAHLVHKNTSSTHTRWFGLLATCLCWVGLAGISWTQAPTTLFENTQKTVFVVDQSLSMYATDIKPNRQTQLKQTLRDILAQSKEGDLALVAFAGEGFVISPFSQDRETITHFLLALDPIIMPTYGSNLTDGIKTALSLNPDKAQPLHLILLTDDLTQQDQAQIPSLLASHNVKVDMIAVGSKEGAVIRLPDGQTLKQNGKNVVPSTPIEALKTLTRQIEGRFFQGRLSPNEISQVAQTSLNSQQTQQAENKSINWIEQGHWFALPFLLWLALHFRRGMLYSLLLTAVMLPTENLSASPLDWFMTSDQKGQQAANQDDWQTADQYFTQPKWKAASSYALEKYESTIQTLSALPNKNAAEEYNLGNALALSGDIQGAIQAYEKALALDPKLDAAQENLDYVKQQEQKQKQQQDKQDSKDTSDSSNSDSKQEQSPPTSQDQSDSDTESDKKNASEQDEKQDNNTSAEDNGQSKTNEAPQNATQKTPLNKEQQQALDQWLRQIQDDPGSLLQRKLWYLHQERRNNNRSAQEEEQKPW
ncbi:vWA domain-containing protein [Marinomonas algarum]|uniref:VWA domain-containing protein n=1 Tax=Marinomonas algarum TaxID=2883105 RepID=A0A9X1IQN1_9GAMM|nr:VWA domain-containing protein [Marinomonas algarum]MCB5162406.1 VWA domain-containing protein [Marinomonas algarum]